MSLKDYGARLIANGYLVIPIKPGAKRPSIDQWQSARLTVADLSKYTTHGAGVLCGQGEHPICAIDVDVLDAALAQRFTAWCTKHLGFTCERVGQAPKMLLVYRAAEAGWHKVTGAWFADAAGHRQRVEVLGDGQQFVAYHTHPDTGKPYEWVDFIGGIAELPASSLPVITHAQVAQAVEAFEAMALEAGLTRASAAPASRPLATTKPVSGDDLLDADEGPVGITLDDARALLAYVDAGDYDAWLRVGMSLHHEYEGAGEALTLWNAWSAAASNYAGLADLESRWEGFGRSGHRALTIRWLIKLSNEGKRAAVKAEQIEVRNGARVRIARCADTIDLLGEVAQYAGQVAAQDVATRIELVNLIRNRFHDLTGTRLPVGDVRKAMADRPTPLEYVRRGLTEFGNADRLLDKFGAGLLFVPELDCWYSWAAVHWERVPDVMVEHLAKETVKAIAEESKEIEDSQQRTDLYAWHFQSQSAKMVRNMVQIARSDIRVVTPLTQLDPHSHLLGAKNGAIDLQSGFLLPPRPDHRITMTCAVDYDSMADCPLWRQTLLDVFFNDADMVAFFQRLIGYSLMGTPTEDVLCIPYGSGANGKSTVLGAIREVLGDYAKMSSADTFLTARDGKNGGSAGGAREDILRLRGSRFVYVTEPDEGAELKENIVKSTTGGDAIPARALYAKHSVEVVPTWVTFMPTNHRPVVRGDDYGIWRRLLLVPFERNFEKDPTVARDKDRADNLRAEYRGILRWCVEGALAYQREGLNRPGKVLAAVSAYRDDMDLLSEWVETCCDVGASYSESTGSLWASWEAFARSRGELRLIPSARSLGRRLANRFVPTRGTGGARRYAGIRIKDSLSVEDFA